MLKIASYNFKPHVLHPWMENFVRAYCETDLNYEQSKSYRGDAIVALNGRPDQLMELPSKLFRGKVFAHLMDYSFCAGTSYKALQNARVYKVLGYAKHDKYDPFFQKYYPEYIDRLIPVPFGAADRFKNTHGERKNKCVGLGSINPTDEGLLELQEYAEFNKNQKYSHPWREVLRSKKDFLGLVMDSYFPIIEKHGHKRFDYSIENIYNEYQFFTTCESIQNFPSVKVFEGMASGCVFVGNNVPCYRDLGLIDGENCILHKKNDLSDFVYKVDWYQRHPEEVERLAKNAFALYHQFYTPDKIAGFLFHAITASL